jgi:hypothetical protein
MVAGNPCYTTFPPSLPERTTSAATLYIKPRTGVVPPILPPEPGEQVRITVGSCYGPESPLPQVGGNILYPRARQGVVTPTEPPTPGADIRITVGNCYIPGEPPRVVVPQEPDSPAIVNVKPKQGTIVTPPAAQPGDLVRAIVDNCYGPDSIPLSPDEGPYLPRPKKTIEVLPAPPEAADIIRQLVDNCYGPRIPLTPDLGPYFPPPTRIGIVDPPPTTPAGEAIRLIVQRCYPTVEPPPEPTPEEKGRVLPPLFPDPPPWKWLCELFPDLPICDTNYGPFPTLGEDEFIPIIPDGPDCAEVEFGLRNGSVKRHKFPQFKDKWKVISGPRKGDILTCKRSSDEDTGVTPCVTDFLDCLFKPYATGTYRTPPVSCDNFYFRGQNSTSKEICIANCQGERIPIYEYLLGGNDTKNVMLKPISGDINGGGGFIKHNLRVVTTDSAGNYTGRKVFCEAGAKFFNSTSVQTYTTSLGGASVTFKVQPIADGSDFDSNWWVDSFSGSLPSIGTETDYTFNGGRADCTVTLQVIGGAPVGGDHRYGLTPTPDKPGYTVTNDGEPVFYLLKNPDSNAKTLWRFYSDSTVDTFLTMNPGSPESQGAGERATMDAAGMSEGMPLGYAFQNKDKASASLVEGERIQELHRYYNGNGSDMSCEFDSNGNVVCTGSGTAKLKLEVSWDDNPSTAGTSFETISASGNTVRRSGEKGSGSLLMDVTNGTNTVNYNRSNAQGGGISRQDNNKKLCLKDGDGSDCNASVRIGAISAGVSQKDDHKYSIVKRNNTETPPSYDPSRLSYQIPSDNESPMTISYQIKKGGAAYENSWGVAITNKDGDQIYWARVIEANTTADIPMQQYQIPVDVLNQYKNKEVVFFLVPDGGSNGLSNGQSISFSSNGNAFTNSASAQSNWVFFSNHKMNPDQRNKVKFHAGHEQWWEDLHGSDSDEDYDDFKVTYRVAWVGSEWLYEGIACYVFGQPAPPPIMIPILVRENCEDPLFNGTFRDAIVTRTECGSRTPPNSNNANRYSLAGVCSGEYSTTINRKQRLTAQRSGNLSLKAFGSIIRSPEIEDLRFKYRLVKNGTILHQDSILVGDWPVVGSTLTEFTVVKGDVIKFQVVEIQRGPRTGLASLGLAIFDRDDNVFEKPWNVDLGTTAITGEVEQRSQITSDNPRVGTQSGLSITTGGRIKKMSIRLWDIEAKTWSKKVTVWDNGQLDTNGANGQDASWSDMYYDGDEWFGSGFYEGGSTNRRGVVLSSNIDNRGRFTGNPNVSNGRGIFYNSLFEHGRGLICQPSNNIGGNLSSYRHLSNSNGFMGWFTQSNTSGNFQEIVDAYDQYYAKGINDSGTQSNYPRGVAVNSNGQYSKMSFMHDYVLGLVDSEERLLDEDDLGPQAKVRVAFWPYSVKSSDMSPSAPRFGNSIYWACGVEMFGLLDRGTSYQAGQTFDLQWPPYQKQKDMYGNANDGSLPSPFYPRDNNSGHVHPKRLNVNTIGTDINDRYENTYSPKEVFYQESHNRDSNLWYMCQSDRKVKRIKFRIEIEEVE